MSAAVRKPLLLPLLVFAFALSGFAFAASAQQPASSAASSAKVPAAVQVDDQKSFTVVGYTVRTTNAAEASGQGLIPQLWGRVMQGNLLDAIPNSLPGIVVVYSDYASDASGQYNYTLGVRVSSVDKLPEGTVVKTVQAGRYAVLSSDEGPPQDVVPALWKRIAAMTPQQLGGARAYRTDFEVYPDNVDFNNLQMVVHIGVK